MNQKHQHSQIPEYLKCFIELHLDNWILNAFKSVEMESGKDYIVDVNRHGKSYDLEPNIIIIETDTGTDQSNSQWNESLHQFLQIKHRCKISPQSLKAVFISNTTFFSKYSRLFGMTGTLGSKDERELLKAIYKIDFLTIPTALPKKLIEYDAILLYDKNKWMNYLIDNALIIAHKNKRSVLVVCETIKEAENLFSNFQIEISNKKLSNNIKLHIYKRDHETFDIFENNQLLSTGNIIISTNLAGRGTDLKIDDELNKNGGLHVYLSYLPSNIRIEQQAFGRSARKGNNGSAQMIIFNNEDVELKVNEEINLMNLIELRENVELARIQDIKEYYNGFIKFEEELFDKFKSSYSALKCALNKAFHYSKWKSFRELILEIYLDKWALWLDKANFLANSLNEHNENSEKTKTLVSMQLDKFIKASQKTVDSCQELLSFVDSPSSLIKLACQYIQNNKYEEGKIFLDACIQRDCTSHAAAFYFQSYLTIKSSKLEKFELRKEIKKLLVKSRESYNEKINTEIRNAGFVESIGSIFEQDITYKFIKINSYQKQKECKIHLYNLVKKSISDILGDDEITTDNFEDIGIELKSKHSETPDSILIKTIVMDRLIDENILKGSKVKKNIENESLEYFCFKYLIKPNDLKQFLDQTRNKKMNFANLLSELKAMFPNLISREHFWEILLKYELIFNETEYVLIHRNKNLINPKIREIQQPHIKLTLENSSINKISFLHEVLDQENAYFNLDDYLVFYKKTVLQFCSENDLELERKNDNVIIYKDALINKDAIVSCDLEGINELKVNKNDLIGTLMMIGLTQQKSNGLLSYLNLNKYINIQSNQAICLVETDLSQVKWGEYRIYKNDVSESLLKHFHYKCELKLLTNNVKNNQKVKLQLANHVYNNLLTDLVTNANLFTVNKINKKLINNNDDQIEKTFKSVSKLHIYRYFKADFPSENEFWKELREKNWILNSNDYNLLLNNNPTIESEYKVYSIYQKAKAYLTSENSPRRMLKDRRHEAKLSNLIESLLYLVDKLDVRNNIKGKIKSLQGITALETPDVQLSSLFDLIDSKEISRFVEEIYLLRKNGLDLIMSRQEKRWSSLFYCKVFAIALLGIAQIAIGVMIEYYTAGIGTNLASGLINEGIGDILFSMQCLHSGYLTWDSYLQHKKTSLLLTAVTVGVGSWYSRGTQLSKFGNKIDKNLSTLCGPELRQYLSSNCVIKGAEISLPKLAASRFGWKIYRGVATGLLNMASDHLIDAILQNIFMKIANTIRVHLCLTFQEHSVGNKLEVLHKKSADAEKLVAKWTKECIENDVWFKSLQKNFLPIINSFSQGLRLAGEKITLPDYFLIIDKISKGIQRVSAISNLLLIVKNFLDEFAHKIDTYISSNPHLEHAIAKQSQTGEKFKADVYKNWETLLDAKIASYLKIDIAKPLASIITSKLVNLSEKQIKNAINYLKTRQSNKEFDEANQALKRELDNLEKEKPENRDALIEKAKEKFQNKLNLIAAKCRDKILCARIIRANGQLGPVAIQTLANLTKRKIIVVSPNGEKHEFAPLGKSSGEPITIQNKMNQNNSLRHFNSGNGNSNSENTSSSGDFNCLLSAVIDQIENRHLAREELAEWRSKIADTIQNGNDENINRLIINTFENHYKMSYKGLFGGVADEVENLQKKPDFYGGSYKSLNREFKRKKIRRMPQKNQTNKNVVNVQANHTPPKFCYKGTPYSKISENDMPAVLMKTEEHRKLPSTGRGKDQDAYRKAINQHLKEGNFWKAIQDEFKSMLESHPGDYYKKGINEALDYCLNTKILNAPNGGTLINREQYDTIKNNLNL